MCVTIEIWRAAIGHFQFSRIKSNMTKMHHHHLPWAKLLIQCKHLPKQLCNILLIAAVIQTLLLCSGIHPNPGPDNDKNYHDLSICHVNIRSLKTKDKLGFMSKLIHIKSKLGNNYGIITVSETWLSGSERSTSFSMRNYQPPFRRDRTILNGPTGYGGVLAWVHDTIACKWRIDLELQNIEAMWLEIRSKNNKFLLCVAYRPPTYHDFWDVLQTNFNLVNETSGVKIILTGDLNADPSTPDGQQMLEFANANGLTVHINEATRITQYSKSILDQFLSNIPQMFKSVSVSDAPVSTNDHCTITASLLFRK